MKNFVFIFCLLVLPVFAFGQEKVLFSDLRSAGVLPKEFYSTSFSDYLQQRNQIDISKVRKERLVENQFYLETNYWLYDLQYSGRILYGDPLGKYVNDVIDSLLGKNVELRNKIHVYIIKSSSLNAFTTHQGNIYVNLGLLARIRTEAELAFILAHEIEHFIHGHVLKGYMFSKSPNAGNSSFSAKPIYEDSVIRIHNYSQAMEYEADTMGFHLFASSKYNIYGAQSAFQLLGKADEPLFSIPIDKGEFDVDEFQYIFPDSLFDNPKPAAREKSDGRYSSHPVVQEREKVVVRLINKSGGANGGKDFLQSPDKLELIRSLAQHELSKILIQDGSYVEAIYYSALMKDKYPDDEHYQKWFCKSLTSFAFIRNGNRKIFSEFAKKNLEISKFEKCLYFLSSEEILSLAMLRNWSSYNKCDHNEDILFCLRSTLVEFKLKYQKDYELLAHGNYKGDSARSSQMVFRTLPRLFNSPDFKEIIAQTENASLSSILKVDFNLNRLKKISKGNTLILPSVNIILDFRQLNDKFDFVESEKENICIDNKIAKKCSGKNSTVKILSPYIKQHMSVEEYNDMSIGKDIVDDIMLYGNGFTIIDLSQIRKLKERNNSKYLMWDATITGIDYTKIDPQAKILIPLIFFPSLGYFAWREIRGRTETVNFPFLLDMDNMSFYSPQLRYSKNSSHSRIALRRTNLLLSKIKRK
jgi:hypothetical protein